MHLSYHIIADLLDAHRVRVVISWVAYIAQTDLAGFIRNITSAEVEAVDASIRAFGVEAVVLGSLR